MLIHDAIKQHFINTILVRLEVDQCVLSRVHILLRLQAKVVRSLWVSHASWQSLVNYWFLGTIQAVDLEELYKLSLRLTQVETWHEACDAQLLDYFEQVNLRVQLAKTTLENALIFRKLPTLTRPATEELAEASTTVPVQLVEEFAPAIKTPWISKDGSVLKRLLEL